MSTAADLTAAATCVDNQPVYRNLVDLEILSTFGFQSNRWLADIAPHVLSAEQRAAVVDAKCRAELRVQAESTIPRHLLFTKGHATAIPTFIEAQGIAAVRRTVADLLSISVDYTEPLQIQARYRELHV